MQELGLILRERELLEDVADLIPQIQRIGHDIEELRHKREKSAKRFVRKVAEDEFKGIDDEIELLAEQEAAILNHDPLWTQLDQRVRQLETMLTGRFRARINELSQSRQHIYWIQHRQGLRQGHHRTSHRETAGAVQCNEDRRAASVCSRCVDEGYTSFSREVEYRIRRDPVHLHRR
jgi:hypothetical protein